MSRKNIDDVGGANYFHLPCKAVSFVLGREDDGEKRIALSIQQNTGTGLIILSVDEAKVMRKNLDLIIKRAEGVE